MKKASKFTVALDDVKERAWLIELECIGVNITAFGRKLALFSAIPFSRFSLHMSRFFVEYFELGKCALCAVLSAKWNSDHSLISFHCLAKLMRSINL